MNTLSEQTAQSHILQYLKFIARLCPLIGEDELAWHATRLSVCELSKKEMFIKAGDLQKNVGFITKGLIRSFYIDAGGNEITEQFVPENSFAAHYSALLDNQPSRFYYQCLEHTVLVNIPYDAILAAYDFSHSFERFGRLIAEKSCQTHRNRIESFLFDTAEKRYMNFIHDYPNLFNRISITHLCSYLGVERQTLTRIRSKLSNKLDQGA